MNIFELQNTPANLNLLATQRYLYTQAKNIQRWRVLGTVGLAGVAPFILILFPNSKIVMAIIGGIWLLVSRLILEDLEAKKIKQAANAQEQFDTVLFKLPWNHILVGTKLSPELISSAEKSFSGNRERLKNWYADTGDLPYPLNVLLCQRSNLVWDWRLRRHYAWIISMLTALLFGFGIVFAVVTDQTLLNYLLAIFMPSLSALLKGIEVSKSHFEIATEKEKMERKISAIWEAGLRNPNSVSQEQCRDIQDFIYILRSKGPLVPDQWYNWLQKSYQVDMESAVANLKSEAERAFANNV